MNDQRDHWSGCLPTSERSSWPSRPLECGTTPKVSAAESGGGGGCRVNPVKVLVLTRYDRRGASSRTRFYQYAGPLSRLGIELQFQALLDDKYLDLLYTGHGRSAGLVARAYWRRMRALRRHPAFDIVWLEKELFPWVPALVERALLFRRPYVADYDDATFHMYDNHRNGVLRTLYRDKIDLVMRRAAAVTAGNEYLAERARRAGCRTVEVIPTVVSARISSHLQSKPQRDGTVIGWIGSPATQHFLDPLVTTLENVVRETGGSFITVGARYATPLFKGHHVFAWSEHDERHVLAQLDIGIMPLTDAPFERGKCGYKLVQYMSVGIPVVASPIGVNRSIVMDGVTGFLATTPEEWRRALIALCSNTAMRDQMGREARRRFELHYCLEKFVPQVAEILRRAAASGGIRGTD